MASNSIQFCMESSTSDWLKAIIPNEGATADKTSSSLPTGELMVARLCPLRHTEPGPALAERRMRPPQDQLALKCPRCDSGHTKFCYYNNYSLSQPRYFCKACRRYWTKGGSLRNVPVGGGCRKNKRPPAPSKKPPPAAVAAATGQIQSLMHHHHHHQTDLHLSNLNFMFDSPGDHFAGGFGFGIGMGDDNAGAPLGAYSIDEACQRLGMPFGHGQEEEEEEEEMANVVVDMKPGNRMLSLEWPDQGCGDPFGYSNGPLGLWAGMINGHGPSSAAM